MAERCGRREHVAPLRLEGRGQCLDVRTHAPRRLAAIWILGQILEHRRRKEGVATRSLVQPIRERGLRDLRSKHLRRERAQVIASEWLEVQLGRDAVLQKQTDRRVDVFAALGRSLTDRGEHEDRGADDVAREIVNELPRRRVRAMCVVEDDHEGSVARDALEEADERLERRKTRRQIAAVRRQCRRHTWEDAAERGESRAAKRTHLIRRNRPQVRLERLDDERERDRRAERRPAADEASGPRPREVLEL